MNAEISQPTPSIRARMRMEVHAAILDAAEGVVAEAGLGGGRMEQIAERAGVAVGTMYNYFKNREGLLQTLLTTRREELLRRLDVALRDAGPQFDVRLRVFVDTVLAHALAHRRLFALLVQEANAPFRERLLPPPGQRTFDLLTEKAQEIVALGIEQGRIRRDGAESWPLLLVSTLRTLLVNELSSGTRHDSLAAGRIVAEFFLRGAGTNSHE